MKIDRQKVYKKYNGRCAYCGHKISIEEMEVDHITSKVLSEIRGESKEVDRIENLNPSCRICNHYKRGAPLDDFRNWLLGELHIRITKFPRRTKSPKTQKRKDYLQRVCERYGITPNKPFNRVFYFETIEEHEEDNV
ncbi:MAG: HNH endonuclease signature motif containing protein [Porphyromonas sp.]|nr:HNH endonuclease signature motif containing protein [Porphyromonas sp.]